MSEIQAQEQIVPVKKKMGRPPGTKNKRPYNRKVTDLVVKQEGQPVQYMEGIPKKEIKNPIAVPVEELADLARYIDYWKNEANLTTFQCLALYAR